MDQSPKVTRKDIWDLSYSLSDIGPNARVPCQDLEDAQRILAQIEQTYGDPAHWARVTHQVITTEVTTIILRPLEETK